MHIIIESTSTYHEHIAHYLHNHGVCVSVVNPKQTHHFFQSLSFTQMTDAKDSLMLAKYSLAMQPALWQQEPDKIR